MNEYDNHAAALQRMNRESEAVKAEKFDEDTVRRSIVYTREDVAMLASYMSSLNSQLASLRRIGWVLVALVALILIRGL